MKEDNAFHFVRVESSNVEAVAYGEKRTLRVRFKRGLLYDFRPVPEDKYIGTLLADSTGKAILALGIKGEKVESGYDYGN